MTKGELLGYLFHHLATAYAYIFISVSFSISFISITHAHVLALFSYPFFSMILIYTTVLYMID